MEESQFQNFPNPQILAAALVAKARGKLNLTTLQKLLWEGFNLNDEEYEKIKQLEGIKTSELSSELKKLGVDHIPIEEIESFLNFYFKPDLPTQRVLKIIFSIPQGIFLSYLERQIELNKIELKFPILDYLEALKLGYKKENIFIP
ncbi:MAG: hypothetical protein QXI23_01380 [Candidatus Aenigmatarchaeota archaeon]